MGCLDAGSGIEHAETHSCGYSQQEEELVENISPEARILGSKSCLYQLSLCVGDLISLFS